MSRDNGLNDPMALMGVSLMDMIDQDTAGYDEDRDDFDEKFNAMGKSIFSMLEAPEQELNDREDSENYKQTEEGVNQQNAQHILRSGASQRDEGSYEGWSLGSNEALSLSNNVPNSIIESDGEISAKDISKTSPIRNDRELQEQVVKLTLKAAQLPKSDDVEDCVSNGKAGNSVSVDEQSEGSSNVKKKKKKKKKKKSQKTDHEQLICDFKQQLQKCFIPDQDDVDLKTEFAEIDQAQKIQIFDEVYREQLRFSEIASYDIYKKVETIYRLIDIDLGAFLELKDSSKTFDELRIEIYLRILNVLKLAVSENFISLENIGDWQLKVFKKCEFSHKEYQAAFAILINHDILTSSNLKVWYENIVENKRAFDREYFAKNLFPALFDLQLYKRDKAIEWFAAIKSIKGLEPEFVIKLIAIELSRRPKLQVMVVPRWLEYSKELYSLDSGTVNKIFLEKFDCSLKNYSNKSFGDVTAYVLRKRISSDADLSELSKYLQGFQYKNLINKLLIAFCNNTNISFADLPDRAKELISFTQKFEIVLNLVENSFRSDQSTDNICAMIAASLSRLDKAYKKIILDYITDNFLQSRDVTSDKLLRRFKLAFDVIGLLRKDPKVQEVKFFDHLLNRFNYLAIISKALDKTNFGQWLELFTAQKQDYLFFVELLYSSLEGFVDNPENYTIDDIVNFTHLFSQMILVPDIISNDLISIQTQSQVPANFDRNECEKLLFFNRFNVETKTFFKNLGAMLLRKNNFSQSTSHELLSKALNIVSFHNEIPLSDVVDHIDIVLKFLSRQLAPVSDRSQDQYRQDSKILSDFLFSDRKVDFHKLLQAAVNIGPVKLQNIYTESYPSFIEANSNATSLAKLLKKQAFVANVYDIGVTGSNKNDFSITSIIIKEAFLRGIILKDKAAFKELAKGLCYDYDFVMENIFTYAFKCQDFPLIEIEQWIEFFTINVPDLFFKSNSKVAEHFPVDANLKRHYVLNVAFETLKEIKNDNKFLTAIKTVSDSSSFKEIYEKVITVANKPEAESSSEKDVPISL